MKKTNTTKTIISVIVIVTLAVFIININKLISPKMPVNRGEPSVPTTANVVKDYGECFSKDPSTIVFVHSDYCSHCRNMMPIIEELEKEGYKFYWAESSDSEAIELVNNCFNDLLSGYVPQFICPETGEEITGGMSKAELKEFADDCNP